MNLPKMDGAACLIAIKEHSALKHIPVIMYTTSACRREMEKVKNLGAVHFITKPATLGDLCERIKEVIIR